MVSLNAGDADTFTLRDKMVNIVLTLHGLVVVCSILFHAGKLYRRKLCVG